MADGLIGELRRLVFEWLGLEPDATPRIDRLAFYRARVDVCASDGSTMDVTPEDTRISPMRRVPVRVGVPGSAAVVVQGARVLIGWEDGDDEKPYATPAWESATVTKLVLNGTTVVLGAEAGAQFVALSNLVNARLQSIYNAINGAAVIANDGGAALKANIITALQANGWSGGAVASVAAAQVKAK